MKYLITNLTLTILLSYNLVFPQEFFKIKTLNDYELNRNNIKQVKWIIEEKNDFIFNDNDLFFCITNNNPVVKFNNNGKEIYRNFACLNNECIWKDYYVEIFYVDDSIIKINIYDISSNNLICVGTALSKSDFLIQSLKSLEWYYVETDETYSSTFTYSNDKLITSYIYFPDYFDVRIMNTFLTDYKYVNQNLVEETIYNYGVPFQKKVYDYDKNNKIVSVKYYKTKIDDNFDYKFQLEEEVLYSKNKIIRKSSKDNVSELKINSIMKKDKNNRIRKIELFTDDGTKNLIVSKYNNSGKEVVSKMILPDQKVNYVFTIKYDSNNREIFSSFIFPNNQDLNIIKTTEYSFDKNSNWIEKTITVKDAQNRTAVYNIKREIEYY